MEKEKTTWETLKPTGHKLAINHWRRAQEREEDYSTVKERQTQENQKEQNTMRYIYNQYTTVHTVYKIWNKEWKVSIAEQMPRYAVVPPSEAQMPTNGQFLRYWIIQLQTHTERLVSKAEQFSITSFSAILKHPRVLLSTVEVEWDSWASAHDN